jgi:Aminoglycoside-2''-adenylyltransferase
MNFYDEFKALIDLLNREGVDYAVCGGVAVAFHGYPRLTDDIDILVQEQDLARISEIVKEVDFVFDAGRIPFDVGRPNQREIQRISKILGEDVLTLDLLIVESVYQSVWDNRGKLSWEGRQLGLVSLDGLLEMKHIAGRNKDLLDIDELTKIKENTHE